MINIKAGVTHLREMTAFYKAEGDIENGTLEDSLKKINDKMSRIYTVVKNDPNCMRQNFDASATAIQNIMAKQYKNRHANSFSQDDD